MPAPRSRRSFAARLRSRCTPRRLFVGESLEARWTPAWSGVPPTSISPPASAVAVTLNSQNDATGTAAITSTEIDYYTFIPATSGSYILSATTPSSNLDTVLGLFSSTGARLAYNDDISSANRDSRVTVNLTAGTRYYIGVTNYTGSAAGSYTWTIDGPAATTTPSDDTYENNDTFATASNLGTRTSAVTLSGLVMADGDDYYKFTTTASSTSANSVSISFQNSQGDLDLALYNSAGTLVAQSNGVTNEETVSLNGLAAGTYTVRVFGYQGVANPSYSLSIAPPTATSTPTIDLLGARLTTSGATAWGQTITVSASVRNSGNTAAGAFSQQWYLARDAAGSSDDILLSRTGGAGTSYALSGLAAGATSSTFTATLQLPSALPTGWTGTSFYLVMRTDAAGQVTETNESNNFGQAGSGLDYAAMTISTLGTPVTAFPDVAYYGSSSDWNLNSINAPEAWAQGYTGQGVVVAVVDTGVDLSHPDLFSQIWVNADEIAGNGIDDDGNGYIDDRNGWDFSSGDNNPDDANGHGTHVAGTIAAEKNGTGATGVAPDATIMPVRVLSANGSGSDSGVAAGIRYAAANGADIINLSLGGGFSSVIQSAIQYAQQLNVLVIVAAGNESAAIPSYPARHSATFTNVLSVGAYSSSNAIASFSNDVGTSGAVQVDGPGVNIYSTYYNDRYATLSGTSMATPHVAGLAALALSANNSLSAAQLRTLIVNGATRVISGSDSRGGINAAVTVALAAAGQTSLGSTSGTTTQTTFTSRTNTILSRYFAQSSLRDDSPLPALTLTTENSVPNLHDLHSINAASTRDVRDFVVRDLAIVEFLTNEDTETRVALKMNEGAPDISLASSLDYLLDGEIAAIAEVLAIA